MALFELKSAKITKKGQIAIPKDIRDLEGFKEGTKIAIRACNDRIELRPLNQIKEKMFTMLAREKALAKDWLSKEAEKAWKSL